MKKAVLGRIQSFNVDGEDVVAILIPGVHGLGGSFQTYGVLCIQKRCREDTLSQEYEESFFALEEDGLKDVGLDFVLYDSSLIGKMSLKEFLKYFDPFGLRGIRLDQYWPEKREAYLNECIPLLKEAKKFMFF